MVSVSLFGCPALSRGQDLLTGPAAQRHRMGLVALLAWAHPGPVSREKLTAYLWPEKDAERARNLLSQSVYALRKTLGDQAILSLGEELRLNESVVAVDVVMFARAAAEGDLERAATLYCGPFLDGFFISDSAEFDQWMEQARERYRHDFGRVLEGLAQRATSAADLPGAVEWWRRRAAEDPYNARVTLRLMEALEAAGDRAGAIQQARVHAALMDQQFGAGPDSEVEMLAERLRRGPVLSTSSPGGSRAASHSSAGSSLSARRAVPESTVAVPVSGGSTPLRPDAGRSRLAWRLITSFIAAVTVIAGILSLIWLEPGKGVRGVADTGEVGTLAIAVLPFTNLSRNAEEEYFSDGLTEELIGVLSQVRALRVAARTSAFAFKGEHRDIREVGRVLDVGAVLEGSVRKEGDRIRVTAQLINAEDGFHLWSQTYDRRLTDVFEIQADLAHRIADALQAELSPGERRRLARRPTSNPDAHVLYLKGRYFWHQRTGSAYARAIEYFQRAIEADPEYAEAYAGVAVAYQLQVLYGHAPPQPAGAWARVAGLKALELDDELAEAHAVRGGYLLIYDWNAEAAEREFLRSIDLDPSYAYARHLYAILLTSVGRSAEALAQRRKALELDPLDAHLNGEMGNALVDAGQPADALAYLQNAIELDSTYWTVHANMGAYYTATGQPDEAVRAHRRAVALAGNDISARVGLARALAHAGKRDEARRILSELQTEAAATNVFLPGVARVFEALGDVDGSMEWLEQSYRQRHPDLALLQVDSSFAEEPRFIALMRRMGRAP